MASSWSSPPNSAEGFPFLSLALELRFKIYDSYLERTVIRIPGPPIPHTLNLLTTCRAIYDEASPRVLSKATYSLWCTDHLISFLSSLPEDRLQALRHVAIWASPFGLYTQPPNRGYFTTHLLPRVLDCFPGLRLDTLVVRDGFRGSVTGLSDDQWRHQVDSPQKEVDRLFLEGNGWRELRYYTSYTTILDVGDRARLEFWDEGVKRRDGMDSGAAVKILVGEEVEDYGEETSDTAVLEAGGVESGEEEDEDISGITWERIDEKLPWNDEDFTPHTPDDAVISRFDTFEPRPVVVVVRRGGDADISGGLSSMPAIIRRILETFTWKEMKRKGRMIEGAEEPF